MEKSWKIEKRSLKSHRKIIEVVLEGLWELYTSMHIGPPLSKKLLPVFRVGKKMASRWVGIFFFFS